jgi:branched-chain amino acid transport system permease protein
MASFIQLLVSGLATGAIYALVAVGFTLLWQTSQTINFAQGEFVMLPAFFILAAMNAGAPFWLAALIGLSSFRRSRCRCFSRRASRISTARKHSRFRPS